MNICAQGDTFVHGPSSGVCIPSQSFVTINGAPVHVTGDVSVVHTVSNDAHTGTLQGSGFPTINGVNIVLMGDSLTCGGSMTSGQFPTVT